MNRKQFTIAIVLVILLGGAGLWMSRRNAASFSDRGSQLGGLVLDGLDVNTVAGIRVQEADASVTVEKKNDVWTVAERGGYPADFADVSGFLRELSDLKFVERTQVGESLLPRLELVAPGKPGATGTLVELRDKEGRPVRTILVGKKYFKRADGADEGGSPDGRYVMVDADVKRVGLVADGFSRAETKPEEWISKDFVKIEKLQSAALTTGDATNRWTISRTNATGDWMLEGATADEKFDTAKASALGSFFSFAGFTDVVLPPVDRKAEGLESPRTIELRTFDGFLYTLNIGATNEESAVIEVKVSATLPETRTVGADEKPEDKERLDKEFTEAQTKFKEKLAGEQKLGAWAYRVAKWNLDAVMKERREFMADPPAPAEPPVDPSALFNPLQQ